MTEQRPARGGASRMARRPIRFRGVRRAVGPDYRRTKAVLLRFAAWFVGVGTALDLIGRLTGESSPRWSTLVVAGATWLVLLVAADRARRHS